MSEPSHPIPAVPASHRLRAYGIALAAVAGATVARLALDPVLGPSLQFITYFPAAYLTAVAGGFRPTLLAVGLSVLLAKYLFFLPRGSFDFSDPVAAWGSLLFVLVGLGIAWLGETRMRAIALARKEASEARRLEKIAEDAAVQAEESAAQAEEETLRAEEEAVRAQHAYEETRAAHDQTLAVLESTTDGYIGLDRNWRITYVNRHATAALRPHGDASRWPGLTLWETWTELRDVAEQRFRRAMAERAPVTLELWDAPLQRWYEVHAYPTPDGGVSLFFRDVTERKHADQAYRALAEMSPEAILVHRDGRYIYANDAAVRLCGAASPAELLGRSRLEFIPPEYHELIRERDRRVLEERARVPLIEYRWIRLDGATLDVEVASGPVSWRGEPAIQAIARDITQRKRAEERLQQTQRLESVGRLAGGVAHEVNNQMTVILGAAEFLLRRPDLPPWARSDLDHVRQAARRSAAVTSQLLAFGRRQFIQAETLDLNSVVQQAESIVARSLGPAIRLELALHPGINATVADRGQLTQALLNLTLNARDAMPNGGVLRIATAEVSLAPGNEVDQGAEASPGSYVMLRVSDTGVGMDAATLDRAFEPFFTTKPIGQGTGLGLAMVYGMVRQGSGYITAESTLGEGSTFTLYLPRAAAGATVATPEPPAPERPAAPVVSGPGVALVAEDDVAVRAIITRVLQEEGFNVLEAGNGQEALELVAARDGADGGLRLLVTDLAMPALGGRELAERLREQGFLAPVLFISGYPDEDLGRFGLPVDDGEVLRKPFGPDALSEQVRRLTGREPPSG